MTVLYPVIPKAAENHPSGEYKARRLQELDASASAQKFVIPAGKPESSAMDGSLPSTLSLGLGTIPGHAFTSM
jgi:hypothetical protein